MRAFIIGVIFLIVLSACGSSTVSQRNDTKPPDNYNSFNSYSGNTNNTGYNTSPSNAYSNEGGYSALKDLTNDGEDSDDEDENSEDEIRDGTYPATVKYYGKFGKRSTQHTSVDVEDGEVRSINFKSGRYLNSSRFKSGGELHYDGSTRIKTKDEEYDIDVEE